MPYGIDKNLGGDSPENTKWMERCVEKVVSQGKSKESAIAICKATMKKSRGDDSDSAIIVDYDIMNNVTNKINFVIRTLMLQDHSFSSAKTICHDLLAQANYDISAFQSLVDSKIRK